jgi:hypothetical protein
MSHVFAANQRYLGDQPVPEGARLVGYAAMVAALGLDGAPSRPAVTFDTHSRHAEFGEWKVVTARQAPKDTFQDHLDYAILHERIDLALLKAAFMAVDRSEVARYVQSRPTGTPNRQAWFLCEWLTGRQLDIVDSRGNYAPALDPDRYVVSPGTPSRRHRIVDNMGGTPQFCPVIRRPQDDPVLRAVSLRAQIALVTSSTPPALLRRAASSLLLGETITTYAIEGIRPPRDKLERWGKAILQAGRTRLDEAEITRLQALVLADGINEPLGYRAKQNYVGSFDREFRAAPERVNPRPEDVRPLMSAWEAWVRDGSRHLDPVTAAAAASFSFVYVHPLADGNGRLHRYILHHVLSERGMVPPGIVFPVSMPIAEKSVQYKAVLNAFDARAMSATRWRPSANGGVEVLNDASDVYRFPDLTEESNFVRDCVDRAAYDLFPHEVRAIENADRATEAIRSKVDMSEDRIRDFLMFTRQNPTGKLPKKRAKNEFKDLSQETISELEEIVDRHFGDDDPDMDPVDPNPAP